MRANTVSSVIFSNSNDEALKELTENRSMSSVPFGCRYRLIDFTLSNLANAGITNIGIITKENYRSLMDHVGSGLYWDLDRKNGGLHIIPPFITGGNKLSGLEDTCFRATEFISGLNSEYIIVCESGVIANIDITALINSHIKNDADITFVYRKAEHPDKFKNTLKFKVIDQKIISSKKAYRLSESGNFSMGIAIFKRAAFIDLVGIAKGDKDEDVFAKLISENISNYKMFGFEHTGFAAALDNKKSFYENSMLLFEESVREDLFNKERPVLTKTRDDMPTRYGPHAKVKDCLIADGCIIEGTVKNSILFRGVRVNRGAVVENSILMQGVGICENAKAKYLIADKNSVITGKNPVNGTTHKAFIVKKNQVF